VLQQAKPSNLRKTPSLCGPFKEVHNSRFVFVYGTHGNPIENQALYKQAERAISEWRSFVKAVQLLSGDKDPLMVRDRELQDDQRRKCNLIFIGTPRTNSVLAEIAGDLPIKMQDDGSTLTFTVAGKTFVSHQTKDTAEHELGMNMIYPSPFNPERYIAVRAGRFYGDGLPVNHKFDLLPDYIIYEGGTDRDGTDYWGDAPNYSRCAGYFDNYWKLDPGLMWTQEPAPHIGGPTGD